MDFSSLSDRFAFPVYTWLADTSDTAQPHPEIAIRHIKATLSRTAGTPYYAENNVVSVPVLFKRLTAYMGRDSICGHRSAKNGVPQVLNIDRAEESFIRKSLSL